MNCGSEMRHLVLAAQEQARPSGFDSRRLHYTGPIGRREAWYSRFDSGQIHQYQERRYQ